MIELHYVRTSNGLKVAIMLEETRLPYRVVDYDIFAGEHLTEAFRGINPNQKLPAIVDHGPTDEGEPWSIFETGAILLYLAEKSGQFLSACTRQRMTTLQWVAWQISALGPMLGQGYHFARYAPGNQQYGVQRYTREARRLLGVLDHHLAGRVFISDEYSIADIACWPWVQNIANLDISIDEFPAIKRWSAQIRSRPAVERAISSPLTNVPSSYIQKRMKLTPDQWANLFGERSDGFAAVSLRDDGPAAH